MNDIGLNATHPQPARQPEAVATGLISDGDARDGTPRLGGFVLPAAEQAKQHRLIGVDLLERVAGDPGHDRGHEPARLAHLDDGNEGAGLIEGEKGSAQVIVLRHEKLQGWFDQRWCFTLAGLHSFSPPPWPMSCGGAGAARWAAVGMWMRRISKCTGAGAISIAPSTGTGTWLTCCSVNTATWKQPKRSFGLPKR